MLWGKVGECCGVGSASVGGVGSASVAGSVCECWGVGWAGWG